MSTDDERKVALALFGLDTMADEWAERTNLRAMIRPIVGDDAQADKLMSLMKLAWAEGAYEGRMSQFTHPSPVTQTAAQGGVVPASSDND